MSASNNISIYQFTEYDEIEKTGSLKKKFVIASYRPGPLALA
jgi:hypothetical protein